MLGQFSVQCERRKIMSLKKFKKSEKGFTLIELLIVVAIIGILAAIAIPQFSAYRERSYVSSMQSDARNIATALEAHWVDFGMYTEDEAALAFQSHKDNDVDIAIDATDSSLFTITVTSDRVSTKQVYFDSSTGVLEIQDI
jgi:type IV pilus assembly protein PilA